MRLRFSSFCRYEFVSTLQTFSIHSPCRLLSTSIFSSARERDVELSYTTYPDKDSERQVDETKKPLIFSHGLFGAKGNLHGVSKHLADNGRKVITYDAGNHGDSDHREEMNYECMAEDLSGLIQDLRLNEPVVMGHSMGGKTAMTLAFSKPEIMTALIVADVAPGRSPGTQNIKKYAEAMRRVEFPVGTTLSQARKLAQVQLESVVADRSILQFLLTNLKRADGDRIKWRVNIESICNNYDAIVGYISTQDVQPFTKPTLFVFGEESAHYKSEGVPKIKSLFPNAEITAIKGAGHFVHAEKPLEFVHIVQQFLQSIDTDS